MPIDGSRKQSEVASGNEKGLEIMLQSLKKIRNETDDVKSKLWS
jgi:hypothetical protein